MPPANSPTAPPEMRKKKQNGHLEVDTSITQALFEAWGLSADADNEEAWIKNAFN